MSERETSEAEMKLMSEEGCIGFLEVIAEEQIIVEEVLKLIKEQKENSYLDLNKLMEYFSEKIIIFSFTIKKMKIWEVFNRQTQESHYSYIGNEYLEKTYLLSLINRGEMYGNITRH